MGLRLRRLVFGGGDKIFLCHFVQRLLPLEDIYRRTIFRYIVLVELLLKINIFIKLFSRLLRDSTSHSIGDLERFFLSTFSLFRS